MNRPPSFHGAAAGEAGNHVAGLAAAPSSIAAGRDTSQANQYGATTALPPIVGPAGLSVEPSSATFTGSSASLPHQESAMNTMPGVSAYQPSLNVQDALSYLDKVKIQFADQPEVYNQFLDIMKDFKSHSLDTPGVIDRVSNLFRGYPSLIVGFNTFLPAGYKIEVTNDQSGHSYTITTPDSVRQQHHAAIPVALSTTPHVGMYGMNAAGAVSGYPSLPASSSATFPKKAPVEFNHAINYVNKIKTRYVHDPDTYKQFLEILRTYQNESKPIAEVYAQVQILFQKAPDLLEEFKQFLPDTSAAAARTSPIPSSSQLVPDRKGNVPTSQQNASSLEPPSAKANTSIPVGAAGKYKRLAQSAIPQGAKRSRYEAARYARAISNQYGAAEEFDFFERVKRALGNKTTYTEFLKVLNLFNQDIIDPKVLVEKIEPFLARTPELFEWFKAYIHVDDNDDIPTEIVKSSMPPRDLSGAKRSGSSYRLLPKDYIQAPCGGRDALCYEVLNDNWVCHPTWASEDGGFVAHKKNQYEDAMYRCEEERYEFDLNIEANKLTIQRLEPIAKRIAEMTPEEARAFKLPDGLGDGMSKMIYKRVIKKIYDKDRGLEVIDSLHNHPAVAVPIVLKRLKQKDEEWRRNQREWNKIWRESDLKNYYKSLDHQGINFKTLDKKNFSSKALVNEIEMLYRERREKKIPLSPSHHIQFATPKRAIMEDVKRLAVSYLDKSAQYSSEEQELVQKFLDTFLDVYFPIASHDMLSTLVYERLDKLKIIADNIDSVQTGYSREKNQEIADALDLITKRENPVEIVEGDVYGALHALIDKLFDGEVDLTAFEEQARYWFGTSAYLVYTIDKLIHNLAKQIIMLATEPRCIKLHGLYLRENGPNIAVRIGVQYRQKADEQLEDEENLYKIEYNPKSSTVTIELLGEAEGLAEDLGKVEARWSDYVDNYVKANWLDEKYTPARPVFLKRNLPLRPIRDILRFDTANNLECKICVNTYKMFFVENSEDYFRHRKRRLSQEKQRQTKQESKSKWLDWLDKRWSEDLTPEAKSAAIAHWQTWWISS